MERIRQIDGPEILLYKVIALRERINSINPCLNTFEGTKKLVKCLENIAETIHSMQNMEDQLFTEIIDMLDRLEKLLGKLGNAIGETVSEMREIEDLSEELMDAQDKLGNKLRSMLGRREEMVGREEDMKVLKELLLKRIEDWSLKLIFISGEPGIGKTLLAQHLYNDSEIRRRFKERLWVGGPRVDESNIYKMIDKSFGEEDNGFGVVDLLVVDVETMTPKCLHEAIRFLDMVFTGTFWSAISSKVIITTSMSLQDISAAVKEIQSGWRRRIDSVVHQLKEVADDKSWDLFKSKAFKNWCVEDEKTRILTSGIGSQIYKNCANNLRIIQTAAAILSTKFSLEEWKEFHDVIWPSLSNPMNIIHSKLNLLDAFKSLSFTLKRRLMYCSLFPEDYVFIQKDLIHLWSSTTLTTSEPSDDEDIICDKCLSDFVNQGFFLECNGSYKMVYFMSQLVNYIARDYGWRLVDKPTKPIKAKGLRHVSIIVDSSWHAPTWLLEAKELRSLFLINKLGEFTSISSAQDILSTLRHLETLYLADINCETLLSSIGEMKHLRYLRLGEFSESHLPESLTKLHNLRYLGLQKSEVKRLSLKGLQNLRNLRYLWTKRIPLNGRYPIGIHGELISLQTLDVFIGGRGDGSEYPLVDYNRLNEKIEKIHGENYSEEREEEVVDDLSSLHIGSGVLVAWPPSYNVGSMEFDKNKDDDILLKTWQPSQILKSLEIKCWKGTRFPRFFPALLNCTSIQITKCDNCNHLPDLSILPYLESLEIWGLGALEFIEIGDENEDKIDGGKSEIKYFPSLKFLMLANMPKLKAWSSIGKDGSDLKPTSLHLTELRVSGCPDLMSMPQVSGLEYLEAISTREKLLKHLINGQEIPTTSTSSVTTSKLERLHITSVHGLDSLLINHPKLKSLTIKQCQGLRNISVQSPNSLEVLQIVECGQLRHVNVSRGKLSDLLVWKQLNIEHCEDLNSWDLIRDDHGFESLRLANISSLTTLPNTYFTKLKQLTLSWIYNTTTLPEWIHNLTHLTIYRCPNMTRLPESLDHPSNLQQLIIRHCPKLKHVPKNLPNLTLLRVCGFRKLKETICASKKLRELEIENDMYNFDDEGWEELTGLKSLKLNRICNLEMLPIGIGTARELEELELCRLYDLEDLPYYIGQFTKLERLSIQYCTELSEFPEVLRDLKSLRKLEIVGCVRLQRICQSPSPELLSLIQHIPEVLVDGVQFKP